MRLAVVIVVVAACGRAPHEPLTPQAPPPAVIASPTCAPLPTTADADPAVGIRVEAPERAELHCDEYRRDCVAMIPVTISNCRADPIEVSPTTMFNASSLCVDLPAPHTIASGATWTGMATARGEGQLGVRFNIESRLHPPMAVVAVCSPGATHCEPQPNEPRSVAATIMDIGASVHITNPARDADERACRRCNGDWDFHGMMRLRSSCASADDGYTCNCRTSDHGKACRDRADCEGWCEFDRFEVVAKRGAPPVEVGFDHGLCSEFATPSSCTHPLDGASHLVPAPHQDTTMCLD